MQPANITIRPSHIQDYERVTELSYSHMTTEKKRTYLEVNPKAARKLERQIRGDEDVCFIAEMGSQCVGYVVGGIKSTPLTSIKYAELDTIAVSVGYRGHGIGSKLAKRFLQWSKEVGAARVSVVASPSNDAAIKFYKRLGFIPSSLELELTS